MRGKHRCDYVIASLVRKDESVESRTPVLRGSPVQALRRKMMPYGIRIDTAEMTDEAWRALEVSLAVNGR